jgi:predicted DNA-binding transcriptional regulator AlpA
LRKNDPTFPAPRIVGKRPRWIEEEIIKWLINK